MKVKCWSSAHDEVHATYTPCTVPCWQFSRELWDKCEHAMIAIYSSLLETTTGLLGSCHLTPTQFYFYFPLTILFAKQVTAFHETSYITAYKVRSCFYFPLKIDDLCNYTIKIRLTSFPLCTWKLVVHVKFFAFIAAACGNLIYDAIWKLN